jgi:hypothetical protein
MAVKAHAFTHAESLLWIRLDKFLAMWQRFVVANRRICGAFASFNRNVQVKVPSIIGPTMDENVEGGYTCNGIVVDNGTESTCIVVTSNTFKGTTFLALGEGKLGIVVGAVTTGRNGDDRFGRDLYLVPNTSGSNKGAANFKGVIDGAINGASRSTSHTVLKHNLFGIFAKIVAGGQAALSRRKQDQNFFL